VASGLAIEVTSGGLPAQVLTQTFRYTVKDEGGGASSDDGSGCSGTGNTTWALLAGIACLLGLAVLRRRRVA
jgi:LPXTG-motif cell wall-anchored protein